MAVVLVRVGEDPETSFGAISKEIDLMQSALLAILGLQSILKLSE